MNEKFTIKIDGSSDKEFSSAVVEWAVDTNVFLPSMFTILLRDDASDSQKKTFKYTDNKTKIKIGASIEISVDTQAISTQSAQNQVFKGEITAIEPVFEDNGMVLLRLRGFDRGHRLTLGKNTRTFGDANPQKASLTDSDVVNKIAQKAGLSAQVSASGLSGVAYYYIMQYDQSDWDFLWARAQMLGYQVYVDDKNLHFCPASDKRTTTDPGDLTWGTTLKRFEPRIVSAAQVTESSAWGWDPKTQKNVNSKSKTNSKKSVTINDSVYGEKAVSQGLSMSTVTDAVMYPVIRDSNVSKVIAEARFAEHQTQFVRASGELLYGDPRLLAGSEVEVENVGERFSGKYYVTEAHHSWKRGDYRVRFEVSGRNPYTLHDLLLGREARTPNKMAGVVIGVVTDINDPQKFGRVKVKYPWLPPDGSAELSSNWARLIAPGAGKDRGIFFVPEVNDEVMIAFEQGDVNHPYVVGALWSDKNQPPKGDGGDAVDGKVTNQRIVRSRSGHVIIFDDADGAERIIVMDKTKNSTITINSKDNSMILKTKGDLTLDAGGKMIFKCKQDFSLESSAKASVKASSTLEMQAQSGATMKSGSTELELKPAAATMKSTKVDIQGQAQTNVQGAQTSIKGSAMVEVQGAIVKIN
ncbi:MAG: VgrG-related protein [Anaerolineales bacterium]